MEFALPLFSRGATRWNFILFTIFRLMWKERNDKKFRGASVAVKDLTPFVALRIAKWASIKRSLSVLVLRVSV